jgi:hypothetical protein
MYLPKCLYEFTYKYFKELIYGRFKIVFQKIVAFWGRNVQQKQSFKDHV